MGGGGQTDPNPDTELTPSLTPNTASLTLSVILTQVRARQGPVELVALTLTLTLTLTLALILIVLLTVTLTITLSLPLTQDGLEQFTSTMSELLPDVIKR